MKERHRTKRGPGRMPYRRSPGQPRAQSRRAQQAATATLATTLAGAGDTLTLRAAPSATTGDRPT